MTNKQSTAKRTARHEPNAPSSPSPDASGRNLCQFSFADGRTCRMPRSKKHGRLCIFHARGERELLAAEQAAQRLVSLSGEFKTASDINHVLGELFCLVAENRIPHRDAVSLAYIAQLLLQSLPHVRSEIKTTLGTRVWDATVQQALTSGPPEPPAAPAPAPGKAPGA